MRTIFSYFLTLSLLSSLSAYGQLLPNSIGVAYLTKETPDIYYLTIAFPIRTLAKTDVRLSRDHKIIDSVGYFDEISFFDGNGELLRIQEKTKFNIVQWCENDGGTQYRPTLSFSISKKKFKRPIKAIREIQNIACFVIANPKETKTTQKTLRVSNDIKLEGDYDHDGQIDCFLWTYYDDAENCDGEPKNNLVINLQVGSKSSALRCCGP